MKFGVAGLFLWAAAACAFLRVSSRSSLYLWRSFDKEAPEDAAAIGAVYTSRFQNPLSLRFQLAIRTGLSYLCRLKWYESCWKTNPHNELPYRNLANLV
jgi:hypothetical protein